MCEPAGLTTLMGVGGGRMRAVDSYQSAADGIPEEVNLVLVGGRCHEGLGLVGAHGVVVEKFQHKVLERLVQVCPFGICVIGNRLLKGSHGELLTSICVGVELCCHCFPFFSC